MSNSTRTSENLRMYLHFQQALNSGNFICNMHKRFIIQMIDEYEGRYLKETQNDVSILIDAGIISNDGTVAAP